MIALQLLLPKEVDLFFQLNDLHIRVKRVEGLCRGDGRRATNVVHTVDDLALQVGKGDHEVTLGKDETLA